MGGTYWYFVRRYYGKLGERHWLMDAQYRLDRDVDFYNYMEPWTTSCPFLPGQAVNLLEVPVEVDNRVSRTNASSSCAASDVFTLDPHHKYRALKPTYHETTPADGGLADRPFPVTTDHPRSSGSMESLAANKNKRCQGILLGVPRSSWKTGIERLHSSVRAFRKSSVISVFHRMRGTKSAEYQRGGKGTVSHVTVKGGRTPYTGKRATQSANSTSSPIYSKGLPATSTASTTQPRTELMQPFHGPAIVAAADSKRMQCMPAKFDVPPNTPARRRICGNGDTARNSLQLPLGTHAGQPSIDEPTDEHIPPSLGPSTVRSGSLSPCCTSEPQSPIWPNFDQLHRLSGKEPETSDVFLMDGPGYLCENLTSQPMNIQSSSKDTAKRESIAQACFLGYNIPLNKQQSFSTLESQQLDISEADESEFLSYNHHLHNARVEAWNNGITHQMTALEELVNDLGYLGKAIT